MEAYDEWVSQLQSHDALASSRTEKHSQQDVVNWSQPAPSTSLAKNGSPAPPPPPSATPSNSDSNTPDVTEFSDLSTTVTPQYYSYPPSYYPTPYPTNGTYGPPSWQQQRPPSLPLSNYSTLNGATSSNHPPQGSMSPQSMVIDPALTTTNGGAPPTASGSVAYPFYARPTQTNYHPSPLSINPSFMHDPEFFQSLEAAARAQGVHSPQIFHALPPSMLSNGPASASGSSVYSSASPFTVPSTATHQMPAAALT